MGEQEQFEAVLWGQSFRVAMSSIIPLLLIILLGVNTYVLIAHGKGLGKAVDDAAQFIVKDAHELIERQQVELRVENSNRSREHDDILRTINAAVEQQNRMFLENMGAQNTLFLQVIAKKTADDAKQHASMERAITRVCQAKEKEFAQRFLTHSR